MEQDRKIDSYIKLLLQWNDRINLIGKSTVEDFENRHLKDSSQLLKFFTEEEKKTKNFVDLGTGAGIPGVILSILGVQNMTLIEKSIQKCNFLKEAVKLSNNKIEIINENIFSIENKKFDMIISRALANLTDLLRMSVVFMEKDSRCVFLKGKKFQEEIDEARKHFNFALDVVPSETSDEGRLLLINGVCKR